MKKIWRQILDNLTEADWARARRTARLLNCEDWGRVAEIAQAVIATFVALVEPDHVHVDDQNTRTVSPSTIRIAARTGEYNVAARGGW